MSQTAHAKNGLFQWLNTDETPAAPVSNDSSANDRVVALRKELFEAAQAQLAGAQNAQDMIRLLDALRVAEAAPAQTADDFGAEPVAAAGISTKNEAQNAAAFDVSTLADWQGRDGFGTNLYDIPPSNGWLIDAMRSQEAASETIADAVPEAGKTVFAEGSVLEGRWTLEAESAPKTDSQLEALVIETDNRAELPESPAQEAAPNVIEVTGPSVAERAASLAAPMMATFLGGATRARQAAASGSQKIGQALAKQRQAAQARAEARETARQEAAAQALEQLATQRAAEAESRRNRAEAYRSAEEAPLPFSVTSLQMPQSMPTNDYTPEAVDALLSIPETRWSSPVSAPVSHVAAPLSALPEWLEQKLALHARWLESGGSEGKRYRYTGEDFAGLDLSGQNFAQAQMRSAPLAGIDLSGARLDGADFSEADLSRANLADAQATRAVFARANLTFADLTSINAQGANFNFADLQGAKMKEAHLDHAQMREVNMQGVVAPDLHLAGANLRAARLFESILPGADLRGADLRGAHLERTVFIGTKLEGASLKDAEIYDLDYAQTDFTVALDVPQDVQLAALAAERTKLNEARTALENRFATMQARESRMLANLRVLEHKRHHDGQFEAQETAVIERLESQVRWLRNSSIWWVAMVAVLFGVGWLAMSEVPMASINLPVLGLIASFGVITVSLAVLSFARIWRIRRHLSQLLRHRHATRAAIAEQAVQEAAGA